MGKDKDDDNREEWSSGICLVGASAACFNVGARSSNVKGLTPSDLICPLAVRWHAYRAFGPVTRLSGGKKFCPALLEDRAKLGLDGHFLTGLRSGLDA